MTLLYNNLITVLSKIMLTHESFKELLQKIVTTHLPEEEDIFELEGDSIIDATIKEEEVSHVAETSEQLGAADWVAAVAAIGGLVTIVATAYKTYCEALKIKSEAEKIDESDLENLKEKWIKQLKAKKVDERKAKLIANDFIKEIVKLTE